MNIDQYQMDQLVDGELNETDRRTLIESLDRSPDGWRQCACSFLEAQEFRAAVSSIVSGEPPNGVPEGAKVETVTVQRRDSGSPYSLRMWATLAACLAIGFGIGQFPMGGRDGSGPSLAVDRADAAGVTSTTSTSHPGSANSMGPGHLVPSDPSANSRWSDFVLEQHSSALPSEIEDILGRLGQRVERRRVYVPVELQGGQSGTIPVEEIDIVPVRWETY